MLFDFSVFVCALFSDIILQFRYCNNNGCDSITYDIADNSITCHIADNVTNDIVDNTITYTRASSLHRRFFERRNVERIMPFLVTEILNSV